MKKSVLLLCCLVSFFSGVAQNTALKDTLNKMQKEWTKNEAIKWFNEKVWLNGIKIKPHKSIDKQEFAKQYALHTSRWETAFNYLRETDLSAVKAGRYPLDADNVYIIVTQAPTKNIDSVSWEAHRNYADIHYIISGQEKIGVAPFAGATIKKQYDPTKDIGFYDVKGKFYVANQSSFFIFFPEKDAHRPSVQVNGFDVVKKIVIKIKTVD